LSLSCGAAGVAGAAGAAEAVDAAGVEVAAVVSDAVDALGAVCARAALARHRDKLALAQKSRLRRREVEEIDKVIRTPLRIPPD
jgi:hypothetical protein